MLNTGKDAPDQEGQDGHPAHRRKLHSAPTAPVSLSHQAGAGTSLAGFPLPWRRISTGTSNLCLIFQPMRLHYLAAAQLWKGMGSRIFGCTQGTIWGISTSSTTALSKDSSGRSQVGMWQDMALHWLTAAREKRAAPSLPPSLSPIPSEIRWDNPYFYTSKALQYFAINERSNLGRESL